MTSWGSFRSVFRCLPAVAAFGLSTVVVAGNTTSCSKPNSTVKLKGVDFHDTITHRLDEIRLPLMNKLGNLPNIDVKIPVHESDPDIYAVSLNLKHYHNAYAILGDWLKVLTQNQPKVTLVTQIANSKYCNEVVIIRQGDDSVTLKVRTDIQSNGKRNMNITLYQNDGFSGSDIYWICKGYRAAMLGGLGEVIEPVSQSHKVIKKNKKSSIDIENDQLTSSKPQSNLVTAVNELRNIGVEVFDSETNVDLQWDDMAGYDSIKSMIEETIVNPWKYPEVYHSIASKTRDHSGNDSSLPKAILLEGPPGNGKTLTARILARRLDRPLVYLKLEDILSKEYGESLQKLAKILTLCEQLEGAVIFVDEIDAFFPSRNRKIHEASRRLLSEILQRLDGFHGKSKSLLVCATNRKRDLDAALLSRMDLMIRFTQPNQSTRVAVFARYAKQFPKYSENNVELARLTEGFSCRDIRDVCQLAERRWATKKVKKEANIGDTPSLADYLDSIERRSRHKA